MISNLLGPPPQRRIFISYRRQDAQWFAARLADSLSAYFGDQRVFRDIEGIAGGADFGAVIHDSLNSSDAVIVVIGKSWLNARDEQGGRRLDATGDWVSQEVGTALEKGVPVYPVLVEDTPMPRADELPPSLQPLLRFNAISISDRRWEVDTTRLAKIVSLDIPSFKERRLQAVNLLASSMLVVSIAFLVTMLMAGLFEGPLKPTSGGQPRGSWIAIFFATEDGGSACRWPPAAAAGLLDNAYAAVVFIVLAIVSALLFTNLRHIDESGRGYFSAAAWVAAVGTLGTFILYYLVCPAYEPIVNFYMAMLIAPTVLALMSLSGFKAK